MASLTGAALWFVQESPMLGQGQELNLMDLWRGGGFMMWPLGICLALGFLIIVWKFFDPR